MIFGGVTPPITTKAPLATSIPDLLPAIIQRVFVLEKDVQKLKVVDHTTTLLASLRSKIPSAINAYLGSSLGDALQKHCKKALEKTLIALSQSSSQAQSSLKAVESLSKYELKMFLFEKMDKIHSYLTHNKHQALFDALLNSISLDDAIARGQADQEKVLRKRDHEDEDPSVGPNQGQSSKERLVQKPPRRPTPDPEWNKRQVVEDQPEQPWFNNMVSTAKDSLTFDELMATPIDFSNIELEYNIKECFKALTDKHDWKNPEGDYCPFDLTKPLPLKGRPDRLTIAAEYFFNNDLEFLKSSDPEKKYTMFITKKKVARYEIVGIEDMVPTLWSTTKVGMTKMLKRGSSTGNIFSVVSVKVQKLHGYGHLDEIMVRRVDRQLYKFKEGDVVDLHLNDIKDMLLLTVQHKLFQLGHSEIVNFIVALRMFTRSLIIKRRVEDLQLGVKSNIYTDSQGIKVFPMEAAVSPRRVRFIATCSYPTNICKDIMKAQVHVSKDFRYSDTARLSRSDKVLKLKNFKKDKYSRFQDKEGMSMSV
ncbi:hypothetical protein Tco_0967109 [Tanacetum coccineum]